MTTKQRPLAYQVREVLRDCLFSDDESTNGKPPEEAVIVEGIVRRFGFHPDRLRSHREEIKGFLRQMLDEFHKGRGGGWSFLNLCMTRDGDQWGEHQNMEELVVLAIGSGLGGYCIPRQAWRALPGGMPYVWFDCEDQVESTEKP